MIEWMSNEIQCRYAIDGWMNKWMDGWMKDGRDWMIFTLYSSLANHHHYNSN